MANDRQLARTIAVDAMTRDLNYIGRFAESLVGIDSDAVPIISLAAFPFFSLIVNESSGKWPNASAEAQAALTRAAADVATRSRHTLKLFSDTERGISGQLDFFREEIDPANKERFGKRDLGLSFVDGHVVTTSHASSFFLGVNVRDVLRDGRHMRDISQSFGSYVRHTVGYELGNGATSMASEAARLKLPFSDVDVASDDFYGDMFNGPGSRSLNAMLSCFATLATAVDKVLVLDRSVASRQTIFKLRYIALHQVVLSLTKLRAEMGDVLTPTSHDAIAEIVDAPFAVMLHSQGGKWLRDALMHYGLSRKLDTRRLNMRSFLYGLIPVMLPGQNEEQLTSQLDDFSAFVFKAMTAWANWPT